MPEKFSKEEYEKIKGWLEADLKKSYVMIERGRWWWLIGGFLATLIAALGTTFVVVNKAVSNTGAKTAVDKIKTLGEKAEEIVGGLPTLEPRIAALEQFATQPKLDFIPIDNEDNKDLGRHIYCALSKVQNSFATNVGNTFQWVERDAEGTWWYKSDGHGADRGGVVCITN
jgi:hypothetical protein